jgi:two-component system, chemotaxis family, chemotaxis protein CheY
MLYSARPSERPMPHALVVDDDQISRYSITTALRAAGYRVSEAADGEEVICMLESEQPDVVLMDLMMPQKDGIETIFELRQTHPRLPVIAFTGKDGIKLDYLEVARLVGATRTLKRPFAMDELIENVKQLVPA